MSCRRWWGRPAGISPTTAFSRSVTISLPRCGSSGHEQVRVGVAVPIVPLPMNPKDAVPLAASDAFHAAGVTV